MTTRDAGTYAERFGQLSVPAQNILFGDSLNIQSAADCYKLNKSVWSEKACIVSPPLTEAKHKNIDIPPYNYPPIWARLYAAFQEVVAYPFIKWGWMNAAAITITLMVMAYRWNPLLYPILLISPVTLLCIERGNIDGLTFGALFLPTLILSKRISAFGIGLAASLKIFPIFGFLTHGLWSARRRSWSLIAVACAGLLLSYDSWTTLYDYAGKATKGFDMAYGLPSWPYAKWLKDQSTTTHAIQAIYLLLVAATIHHAAKSGSLSRITNEIHAAGWRDQLIIGMSLAIFIGTFLTASNWAYRFIFIIPAALALQRAQIFYTRSLLWLCILSLWIPVIGTGWRVFNIAAAATVIPASVCLAAWLRAAWSKTPAATELDSAYRQSFSN